MSDFDVSKSSVGILTPAIAKDKDASSVAFQRPVENTAKLAKQQQESSENLTQERQALLDDVKKNLDKLNEVLPITSTNLSFEFDETGSPPFIRVIDRGNDEVIREIPSEEFREVAKALDEFADKLANKGFLFNETA
ncbi:flagellar protein FlaG [Pseudoalteromonas sp. S16_S37]|uniref:flagellar protein FlaG n=1 Tax=Pseudoalteromonas sp. S16_S37 TaxID=2720228 RepID=UPI0016812D01|nr:flagellar protein FlaG [Pseudoalteromonas sp. S16_S37]MBD1582204.1 flagellar protein FlaG [Pseudoalteromonas sp. S16_S37]